MQKKLTTTYHIIFDAIGIEKRLLNSEKFILKLLLEIPKIVNMRILSGPHIVRDYQRGHEGITGVAIIDFSHISIHTFVSTKEIFIDIFSCRPFNYKQARQYLYKNLKVRPVQVATVEVKYPWER